MIITVARFKWTDTSVLSQWYFDGEKKFDSNIYESFQNIFSVEDTDRGLHDYMTEKEILKVKVPKLTCIPYGRYPLEITWSNRFQCLMPILKNVKGFEGVRIHAGNYVGNTDGCLITGYGHSCIVDKDQYMTTKSKDCFSELKEYLIRRLKKELVYLEVVK